MLGRRAKQAYVLGLLCLVSLLSGCVPKFYGYPSEANVLVFSADVWGGTHFDDELKKKALSEALSSKTTRRLEQHVPYESIGGAEVQWFLAFYEVDASSLPPALSSGFELVVIPNGEPKEVTITNKRTGISWLVKLVTNQG